MDQLKTWGHIGWDEAEDFHRLKEHWRKKGFMWEDNQVLVHGDVTPTNTQQPGQQGCSERQVHDRGSITRPAWRAPVRGTRGPGAGSSPDLTRPHRGEDRDLRPKRACRSALGADIHASWRGCHAGAGADGELVAQQQLRVIAEVASRTAVDGQGRSLVQVGHGCAPILRRRYDSACAPVAQWIERHRPKVRVGGSSPSGGASNQLLRAAAPPRRRSPPSPAT